MFPTICLSIYSTIDKACFSLARGDKRRNRQSKILPWPRHEEATLSLSLSLGENVELAGGNIHIML